MQRAQFLVSGGLFAAAVLASASAAGLTRQQIDWCSNRGSPSVSQKITGCTAMIESRRYKGEKLAGLFHNRGVFYKERGDIERAIADFDQAIRRDNKFAPSYYSRGLAYKDKGDLDLAFVDFDQAFRLDPTDNNAYNQRALVYDSDGNLDRALARFDEEVKQHPLPLGISPYIERGLVHYARGEYDDALKDFGMVLQWNPKFGPAWWYSHRAMCLNGSLELAPGIPSPIETVNAIAYDQEYVSNHPNIEECPEVSQAQSSDAQRAGLVAEMNADAKEAFVNDPNVGIYVRDQSFDLRAGSTLLIHDRACITDMFRGAIMIDPGVCDEDHLWEARERELPLAEVEVDSIAAENDELRYRCVAGSSCADTGEQASGIFPGKAPLLLCRDATACRRMAEGLRKLILLIKVPSRSQNGSAAPKGAAPAGIVAPPDTYPPVFYPPDRKPKSKLEQDGTIVVTFWKKEGGQWPEVIRRYPPSRPLYEDIKQCHAASPKKPFWCWN